jgi:Domain of unknown function (DUF4279)
VSGVLDRLQLTCADSLSDDDLRELLAIFERYRLDFKPLSAFLSDANRSWFYERKMAYWQQKIWGVHSHGSYWNKGVIKLVFCSPTVDPDEITQVLGLTPSFALKLGGVVDEKGNSIPPSHLGIWKLELEHIDADEPVEYQIPLWLDELAPKAEAFHRLRALGYEPYLDCKTAKTDCGVCVEPSVLARLAELNISISIWFDLR